MKKIAIFITVCIVGLIVLATIFIRPIEGSYFIVTKNNTYDALGTAKVYFNKATRDCGGVSFLQRNDPDFIQISTWLSSLGEPSQAMPQQILHQGNWFLAESEFENAEPGIILIERIKSGFATRTGWGGSSGPARPEPEIREYLLQMEPGVPATLIKCFDPKVAPFVYIE